MKIYNVTVTEKRRSAKSDKNEKCNPSFGYAFGYAFGYTHN